MRTRARTSLCLWLFVTWFGLLSTGCGGGGVGSGSAAPAGGGGGTAASQAASVTSVGRSTRAAGLVHGQTSPSPSPAGVDVASLNPNNLVAGACSVPDATNSTDFTYYKQFDFAQLYGTNCTIATSWTPGNPQSSGVMQFRGSFYGNDGYMLTIAPDGTVSISVNADNQNLSGQIPGAANGLAPTPLASPSGPGVLMPAVVQTANGPQSTYNFTLVESGNVFTVEDNNNGSAVALSVTDPAIAGDVCSYAGVNTANPNATACCDGPTLWLGTNEGWSNTAAGQGTWSSLSVCQGRARPLTLGAAVLLAPDTDQDATALASGLQMTNHFGVDMTSCEENLDFSPMYSPSPGQDMGFVTCHRNNVSGHAGQSLNYAVHVFTNKLLLTKNLGNGSATPLASCPIPVNGGRLARGTQLPLQISVDDVAGGVLINVNLIDMTTPPQLQTGVPGNQQVNTAMSPSPAPGAQTNQPTTYATLVQNLISVTDPTDDGPYTFGYQFGFYTFAGCKVCWDKATLIPH